MAHGQNQHQEPGLALWNTDPWIISSISIAIILYSRGIYRLWSKAGAGAGIRGWRAACFAAGIGILSAALISPLDFLGTQLFAMHMVQHELLMLAAAPLLVCSRPLSVSIWAFAPANRRRIALCIKAGPIRNTWNLLMQPHIAWLIHGGILWGWHFPSLFQAGLHNEFVHALQHFCFFSSALLFWMSLSKLTAQRQGGTAIISLLTTTIHSGMLGALLTFSSYTWYPAYIDSAERWGWGALEDQQLGGLIMWVPAGFVFLAAGLVIASQWMLPEGQRQRNAPDATKALT